MVYHFSRLQDGLLIDCGAIGKCTGDIPVEHHDAKAAKYGLSPSTREPREGAMTIAGVGAGTNTAVENSKIRGVLATGDTLDFTAATLPDSDIPMLLGLASMAEKNIYIGTKTGLLHMVPPELEGQIRWPEGTRSLQCVKAASGHWILPIDRFEQRKSPDKGSFYPQIKLRLSSDLK